MTACEHYAAVLAAFKKEVADLLRMGAQEHVASGNEEDALECLRRALAVRGCLRLIDVAQLVDVCLDQRRIA